jgi:ABC-type multidrug transport system fused ATPase/permease subunit
MRYRPGLSDALKNLSFEIAQGEHVGLCGRTGAGKTSVIAALLRLVEVQHGGTIEYDGVDISTLGLSKLRSSIAVIPQDPVLFSGSLRYNLDPFNRYSEAVLWDTLAKVGLKTTVEGLQGGLDLPVAEGGKNFSQGQRQLICIARALVDDCRVTLLDEATSSIDAESDRMIQETIRAVFKGRSVITIAHRLQTIMDYDRIFIMDKGRVIEHGTPEQLQSDPDSVFQEMARSAGLKSLKGSSSSSKLSST